MSATAPRSSAEVLLDSCAQRRDSTALVHGDRHVTYGEIVDQVHRLARTLDAHGLQPGDVVTLLGGNAPEMIMVRLAANLLGCGVAQLYNGISVESKAAIVADVECRALIVDPGFADNARQVLEHCSPGEVLGLGPGIGTDLLAEAADQPAEPVEGRARPDDVQQIRHTGGTTGHPKGICYTFATGLARAQQRPEGPQLITSETRLLVCTTIAHAAGFMADSVLQNGGVVVLHDEFEPGAVLETIERERIELMFLLPPLLYKLLDHPSIDDRDLGSLRCIVYGGCKSSPKRLAQAAERLGPVLVQMYGQTEAGMISLLRPEEHDPGRPWLLETVGRPVPTTEVAVCDENGHRLPEGSRGELWVRTGMHMDGYWKQPELTAQTIQDGWVRTGDVGYLDAEGYLHVVDRVKDMIVVVGGHVYTSEVEDVLMEHPAVRHAAVFGVSDPDGAEKVHAAVVTAQPVDAEELEDLVERRKGSMYRPTVLVVDDLPLTDAGKPDKKALRGQLARA
ncbi:AMP-binding protein [Saccharopolyspora rosea]|uniref:AMP-binding protein n=1 Tax=Saccharopolyspora rosea TaxID=524884 RepID=UPI0021DB49A3|nr:AMP-binding protein [Saccharopolyspora rosea]